MNESHKTRTMGVSRDAGAPLTLDRQALNAKKRPKVRKDGARYVNALPPDLLEFYRRFVDWTFYGKKVRYVDRLTGEEKEGPLPVNTKNVVNFWRAKDGLSLKWKRQRVYDSFVAHRRGEIQSRDLLGFVKELTEAKIAKHNRGLHTLYYQTGMFSRCDLLNFDYDDKEQTFLDTRAAAEHVRALFWCQHVIQPSTSWTGTHGYMLLFHDNIPIQIRKRWFKRLAKVIRLELKSAGFKCWKKFDQLKGIAPEVEVRRTAVTEPFQYIKGQPKRVYTNPRFIYVTKSGVLAKFPRLTNDDEVAAFLSLKAVTWSSFCSIVTALEAKHLYAQEAVRAEPPALIGIQDAAMQQEPVGEEVGEGDNDCIGTATVKSLKGQGYLDMIADENNLTAALGCVRHFEYTRGNLPSENDFAILNSLYNAHHPIGNGTSLTAKRVQRFTSALSIASASPLASRAIIGADDVPKVAAALSTLLASTGASLEPINQSLARANQKSVIIDDLAKFYLYFRHNYDKPLKVKGQVPQSSLIGLSAKDQDRQSRYSRNASSKMMKLLIDLKVINKRSMHFAGKKCTSYERPVDLLAGEMPPHQDGPRTNTIIVPSSCLPPPELPGWDCVT